MDRLPLVDQFPYHFYEPRVSRFWVFVSRPYNAIHLLKHEGKVLEIEIRGAERLRPLFASGDGILITPNHPDHADCAVILEASHRLGRGFTYMAAYQLFRGPARFILPRVGAFPVDREGADLKAFKTAVEILGSARHPLVIFPEGEIYHVCDRLTPIREGAVAVATTAARKLASQGKTVRIVPTALKYRFVDGHDPTPALLDVMSRLESRFTWWPQTGKPLVERIYDYADGLLGLKEREFFGASRCGPLKPRIATLRDAILDAMEDRCFGKRKLDDVPVRVKELRKCCLERLTGEGVTPELEAQLRRDLNDLFVALQLFSYPGDYVHECPTVERIAETLTKFQQDTLGHEGIGPLGPRRAILEFGEPIDVGARLAEYAKPKLALEPITTELEGRMQALLDGIGPGRMLREAITSPTPSPARVALPA